MPRAIGVLIAAAMLTGCASVMERTGALWSIPDRSNAVEREWARESETETPPRVSAPTALREGGPGQDVLGAGYRIAFEEERVITGSCWDFVDAVYDAAGYPDPRRCFVFCGSQEGPYADPDLIQPGDWVMHLNLEFGRVTHSSIFVQWIDEGNHIARTLDYVGMNRCVTGDFSQHGYTEVFAIVRPAEKQ